MNRCKLCLYPDTKPDLPFVGGVCSACRNYQNRPSAEEVKGRHKILNQLLNDFHGECIVPSSGGKDSTYIATLLTEIGANVTAVTATTCHLTPMGRANIDNLARHVRTIEVTPNRTVRAKLNRLSLELVGDISWPEHVSIHRLPFQVAMDTGIKLIFYGECPNNQYGGPEGTENTSRMTQRWASEFGGFLGMRAEDFIGMEGITERQMKDYQAPSDADINLFDVQAHFLGWYENWDSERNGRIARQFGMQQSLPCTANWWSSENLDNAQTGLHDHMMFRKYGYGRAVAQLSVDIRKGDITREDAMEVAQERDGRFPLIYAGVHVDEMLARIGLDQKRLGPIMDAHTNWKLFDGKPYLMLKEWADG